MSRLPTDLFLLFATRVVRMFAYGFLSVVLVLYLSAIGIPETKIGLLLTLTLIGDICISLLMTTNADQIGRKRMLLAGGALMLVAGILFAWTRNFVFLLVAATVGVISPSGNEVGPFLSIEQAALSQIISPLRRTQVFAWYNLAGSFATAIGALSAGVLAQSLQNKGLAPADGYRAVIIGYALSGILLGVLFAGLSPAVEVDRNGPGGPGATSGLRRRFGLHQSRNIVLKLSGLFALDAVAGGFVMQSIVAYWFYLRFGAQPAALGSIFFAANILAGISALAAARLANRIGLINTMVFTHLPSNVLLIIVPLMPKFWLAAAVLLLRYSISQMDVPTRQSYMMAVVGEDERSSAAGVSSVARSVGASFAPVLTGPMLASATLLNLPFFFAGALKIIYDLILYRSFRMLKPSEEQK